MSEMRICFLRCYCIYFQSRYVYFPLFRKDRKCKAFLQQKAYCSVGVKSKAVALDSGKFRFLDPRRNFALDAVVLVGDTEMLSCFSGYIWDHGHSPEKSLE